MRAGRQQPEQEFQGENECELVEAECLQNAHKAGQWGEEGWSQQWEMGWDMR